MPQAARIVSGLKQTSGIISQQGGGGGGFVASASESAEKSTCDSASTAGAIAWPIVAPEAGMGPAMRRGAESTKTASRAQRVRTPANDIRSPLLSVRAR